MLCCGAVVGALLCVCTIGTYVSGCASAVLQFERYGRLRVAGFVFCLRFFCSVGLLRVCARRQLKNAFLCTF